MGKAGDHVIEEERHKARESIELKKQQLKERGEQPVTVGHDMKAADVFKFVGLLAFFALMALACFLVWPYIKDLFEAGGVDRVVSEVQNAGPGGVLILLGIQFLQVVVALVPGEVVQIAAGMMYGPWFGAAIILVGCLISSAFIFQLVHRLGAPFVRHMVPEKYMDKFQNFEKTGRLNIIVFVLFLIQGLPKDVFTYIVPSTAMKMKTFLMLATVGRIPGVVVSTYAASGLIEGRIVESAIIFLVASVLAAAGLLLRKPLMNALEGKRDK